jgi:hypothetical protein
MRQCKCGEAKGLYINSNDAKIFGSSIPFCVGWSSFNLAIKNRPVDKFEGEPFNAWIPPINADSIIHKRNVNDYKDLHKKNIR